MSCCSLNFSSWRNSRSWSMTRPMPRLWYLYLILWILLNSWALFFMMCLCWRTLSPSKSSGFRASLASIWSWNQPVALKLYCPASWSQYFLHACCSTGRALTLYRSGPYFRSARRTPQPGRKPFAWQSAVDAKLMDCERFLPWPTCPSIAILCFLAMAERSLWCVSSRSGDA